MSNVNRGDEDPGANTAMFQRFVEDDTKPGSRPSWGPSRRQTAVRIGAIAVVAVVALVILVAVLLG